MKKQTKKHVLYVNQKYGNEATLNETMEDLFSGVSDITWRELLVDILGEDLDQHKPLGQWLDDNYGITRKELKDRVSSHVFDRYYNQITSYYDNYKSSAVKAFDFIRSLNLFETDRDGNGGEQGVQLDQSTADGAKQTVFIRDEEAGQWLVDQCRARGIALEVKFV